MSQALPGSPSSPDDIPEIEFRAADDDLLDEPPAIAVEDLQSALPIAEVPARPDQWLLLGAGHAHLQIVRWWGRRPIPGVQLVLVSAFDRATYSGMLPGVLSGQFPPDALQIDLPALCAKQGVSLIVDRAVALDSKQRIVRLAHHPELHFDLASINIGSVPADERLWQTHRTLVSVKPLPTFLQRFDARLQELLSQYRMAPGPELLQIAIVGGGAAGVELALCLSERIRKESLPIQLRIVDRGADILSGYAPRTVRKARELLFRRGIAIRSRSHVVACDEDLAPELVLEEGGRVRVDLVLWAAGAAPPTALKNYDLPRSDRGFLSIRPTLQTTGDDPVFVVGDAADWPGRPLPKAGVYAVRQASVLWENLRRWQSGEELIEYRPQQKFLALLNCGDGTALMEWNGWTFHSRWAWRLKRWIDLEFVRQFR